MRGLVVALLLGLCAVPCRAAWIVDEQGTCVEEWRSSDLLRGPTAVANAPLLPFRSAAGGWQMARESRTSGFGKVLLPVMLTAGGGVMGFVETVLWLGTGLGDTVTGGALSMAPDEATRLSAAPLRPMFVENVRRPTTDGCGRPSAASR